MPLFITQLRYVQFDHPITVVERRSRLRCTLLTVTLNTLSKFRVHRLNTRLPLPFLFLQFLNESFIDLNLLLQLWIILQN
jgi:hypothetical protein